MSDWKLLKDELPPERKLVQVDYGGYYGLRERVGDDWWNENNDYDDSGEVPVRWRQVC